MGPNRVLGISRGEGHARRLLETGVAWSLTHPHTLQARVFFEEDLLSVAVGAGARGELAEALGSGCQVRRC